MLVLGATGVARASAGSFGCRGMMGIPTQIAELVSKYRKWSAASAVSVVPRPAILNETPPNGRQTQAGKQL